MVWASLGVSPRSSLVDAERRLAFPRIASPCRADHRFASLCGAPHRNAIARPQRLMGVFTHLSFGVNLWMKTLTFKNFSQLASTSAP